MHCTLTEMAWCAVSQPHGGGDGAIEGEEEGRRGAAWPHSSEALSMCWSLGKTPFYWHNGRRTPRPSQS